MPENKPQVYEGDYPYIFVSYAHADRDAVLPIIRALAEEGYRVWYDDGIQAGWSFPDYIADRLFGCSCVLMLISRSSLESGWCRNEVEYALDLVRPVLPVYLEDVELPRALRMRLGSVQALYWYAYATDGEFNEKLFSMRMLDPSLKPEGRRRRGVRPRVSRSAYNNDKAANDPEHEPNEGRKQATADGVERRSSLADYSWGELKLLSRAIADARDEAESLGIAEYYGLVAVDGRLRGDGKPLRLNDGSSAEVRVLGFRHDCQAGGVRAGISFEFVGAPVMHCMNARWTNVGGWEQSYMRAWLNSDFLGQLPDDLRTNIVAVAKRTNNRGRISTDDASMVTATADKLWLLSMSEVYGSLSTQRVNVPWSPRTYDAEGVQYQLYGDRGVTTTNTASCIKGEGLRWWLRSPLANSSHSFHRVVDDGGWAGGYATDEMDVSPGFCI